MSEQHHVIVPDIDVDSHIVGADFWQSIESEIQSVITEIDAGTELTPNDVRRVRSFKNQIDEYVKTFNRALTSAQKGYRESVQQRLSTLGYDRIETYVLEQRAKQTALETERVTSKLEAFTEIVNTAMQETNFVKDTILSNNVVPMFYNRFEKVKSGAKAKMIKDWEPYRTVIKANLTVVDEFLESNPVVRILPTHSSTMQAIINYLRTGNDAALDGIESIMENDVPLLEQMALKQQIPTKADAVSLITQVSTGDGSDSDKIANIAKIIAVATTLTK